MTNDEVLAALKRHLTQTKDALCIHQDELGTYYADPDLVAEWEAVVEAVRSLVALAQECGRCAMCEGVWPLAWLCEHGGEERVCPACRGDDVPPWEES